MTQKVKMHAKNIDNQYVQVYPETVASQVIVEATGQTLEQMVKSGNLGGGGTGKVDRKEFVVTATTNGQTEFVFDYPNFENTDYVTTHLNGEFLHKGEEYTVTKSTGQLPKIVLNQGILAGDKVHVLVEKVLAGVGGGGQLDSTSSEKINNVLVAPEYYVDPVNGNDTNDGKTNATAWKSLAKASQALSFKVIVGGAGTLHLLPGTHNGVLELLYVEGGLLVKGYGSSATILNAPATKNGATYSNIMMTASDRIVLHDLTIDADTTTVPETKAYYPVFVDNTDMVVMNSGVIVDGTKYVGSKVLQKISYGIFATNSANVIMQGTMKNFNRAYYISHLARVVSEDVRYENCEHRETVNGGMFSIFTQINTENIPTPLTYYDKAGLDINTVANGVIIESGSNENGKYEVYANGLVMLYARLEVPFIDSRTTQEISWTLPFGTVTSSVQVSLHTFIDNLGVTFYGDNTSQEPALKFRIHNVQGLPIRTQPTPHLGIDITAMGRWK